MLNDLLFNLDSIIKMADPGIGTYVRYWLHYNNLASSFYKQYSAAKKIQEDYVQQIIDSLVKSRMEKAIIQINGGHISVVDKKTPINYHLVKFKTIYMLILNNGVAEMKQKILCFFKCKSWIHCK